MTDLHTHILPFLDDGAEDMDEALTMLEMARDNGTKIIVTTPHCNIPGFLSNDISEIKRIFLELKEEAKKREIGIVMAGGMEIFGTEDVAEKLCDSVLVFCESKDAEEMLSNIEKAEWRAVGFCFSDEDRTGEKVNGIPVVANSENLLEYIKKNVVDGLLMSVSGVDKLNYDVQRVCMEMGVSTHIKITEDSSLGGESMLDTVGDFTVLTRSIKIATSGQIFLKRLIDILLF